MIKPYGLCSDQHLHAWSAFSTTLAGGINSRLQIILDELVRCAEEVKAAGGDTIVFAGDLFHVRGSIVPEVFNPTYGTIQNIICGELEMRIIAIPGNHDLAGKETTVLGNAMQTLGEIDGFEVVTETADFVDPRMWIIPWHSTVSALRQKIEANVAGWGGRRDDIDLIIHAPVNGVIFGIPDHGFDAQELADFGFKRVFAGHYHDHKEIVPGVFSIGATAHQTWSDPGTKAGFCIVHEDRVDFRASRAPSFVDIDATMDPYDMELAVDGNYVRCTVKNATPGEIAQLRDELMDMHAAGVVINPVSVVTTSQRGTTASPTATTLDASVTDYVKSQSLANENEVAANCLDILNRARSAA